MSFAPVVPPLPQDFTNRRTDKYIRPPIPPLPPNFSPREEVAAPMPERAMPSLPADITRTLDDSVYNSPSYRRPSPSPTTYSAAPGQSYSIPPGAGYPGGFARPAPFRTGPSPAPPPHYAGGFAPSLYNLPNAMSAMSLGQPVQQGQPRPSSAASYPLQQSPSPRRGPSPSPSQGPPALTATLPTPDSLSAARNALTPLNQSLPHAGQAAADQVAWIRDVFFCVDRSISQQQNFTDPNAEGQAPNPITLHAPLPSLLHSAIATLLIILSSAPVSPQGPPALVEPHVAEALYLKGVIYGSDPFLPALASPHPGNSSRYSGSHLPHAGGSFEDLEHSPRLAFQTYSTAARLGFLPAWFKLGRDYELVGDAVRARDCFERGAGIGGGKGTVACLYRLGMAHLLGQLSFPSSPPTALPLLHRAALISTTETPQPAYVYGLILLGEFDRAKVSDGVLLGLGLISRGSTPILEARRHIERAAYLGFAPAQYKLGHAYEYAVTPFPFDPLLSVQYYSLASQQGEAEADMALSKWFLCGADGAFEKDEALALTFAEKAARKGLGSAEFAMGYYTEVGVGGLKDLLLARKWYAKAVSHGNPDAPERLRALSQPAPQGLSRTEHDALTDAKLVRTRTQARLSAQQDGRHSKGKQYDEDAGAVVEKMKAQAQRGAQSEAYPHSPHGHGNDEHHVHESRPYPPQHAQSTPNVVDTRRPQSQATSPSQQTRYSLTDSPAPIGLPTSPAHGRPAGRRASARRAESAGHPSTNSGGSINSWESPITHSMSSPGGGGSLPTPPPIEARPSPLALPARGGGAATFEEMGFKTGKAEEKECVIM